MPLNIVCRLLNSYFSQKCIPISQAQAQAQSLDKFLRFTYCPKWVKASLNKYFRLHLSYDQPETQKEEDSEL